MLDNLLQDARHAIRSLIRDPILALTATAMLAVCIGANTTVFSIVNTVLLRPLPYPGSERILWISDISGKRRLDTAAGPDYYVMRRENRVFEEVEAHNTRTFNWTGIEVPRQVDAAQVSPSFFGVFATPPLLGRYLVAGEEGPNAPHVVVLSFPLWRSSMGGDPSVVGKTMLLDGQPYTIVGVMPQGFDFPHGSDIWKPMAMNEATELPVSNRPMHIVNMVARVKAGVSPVELGTEMSRLSLAIREVYPPGLWRDDVRSNLVVSAIPLQEHIAGDLKPALLVLSGAVGLVLLIACVNLANLLLARASARQHELAVRLALGAGRGVIIRQMLTESLLLALPGGLAGVAIACSGVAFLNATKPAVLDRYPLLSVDTTTLTFTLTLTVLTGLIFGMAPAWTAVGISIYETLKGSSRTQSGGQRTAVLRQTLVIAELSVSLILLIGAGLLTRSFVKLATVDLGFPPDHLLTLKVSLSNPRYVQPASRRAFEEEVLKRVRQLSMVRTAALSSSLPLSAFAANIRFSSERHPLPITQQASAGFGFVSSDFFRTMGIRLERGRVFDSRDNDGTSISLVVNKALATVAFGGEDPIGQRLLPGGGDRAIGTIVGVVANTRGAALGADPTPAIYTCTCQKIDPFFRLDQVALIVTTRGDPHAAIGAVEGQIHAMDPELPIFSVRTMEERVATALAPQGFQLILVGSFAVIALILAAAGVYGVMSYVVSRRTREIGIRMALGAQPGHVRSLVVRESLSFVFIAVVAGLGGAWALTRYVRSMLYGITALDVPTFIATPLLLAGIIFLATLGPARRASHVDPLTALREE